MSLAGRPFWSSPLWLVYACSCCHLLREGCFCPLDYLMCYVTDACQTRCQNFRSDLVHDEVVSAEHVWYAEVSCHDIANGFGFTFTPSLVKRCRAIVRGLCSLV